MVSLDLCIRTSADRSRFWLAERRHWLDSSQAAIVGVGVAGLLLEAALLLGWLSDLSWITHPGFFAFGTDGLVRALGGGATGIDRFVVLLLEISIPYAFALAFASRVHGRAGLLLAFAGAAIFGVTMLAIFPAGGTDVFSNIIDARRVWLYHLNPIVTPPSAIQFDPLYQYLHYWQQTPSPYGPLWFLLTGPAVLFAGAGRDSNLIAFKALPLVFELISLGLIALIVRRIRPRQVGAAVILFGWNPLILWEFPGNGHNDIVMMTFVLLAVLLALGDRWPLAFVALAASVLVKYVSLILFPIFILWLLRRHGREALVPLLQGLLGAVIFGAAVFWWFWAGSATFTSLHVAQNRFISSPAAALLGTWSEQLPNTSAVAHVKNELTVAFLVLYGLTLLRMRTTPEGLICAAAETMFLFLVLMTWWFWPWYVVWLLAIAALVPRTDHAHLAVLFSFTALLVYVASSWRLWMWNFNNGFAMALGTALLVFLAPVLYALMHIWLPNRSEDKPLRAPGG